MLAGYPHTIPTYMQANKHTQAHPRTHLEACGVVTNQHHTLANHHGRAQERPEVAHGDRALPNTRVRGGPKKLHPSGCPADKVFGGDGVPVFLVFVGVVVTAREYASGFRVFSSVY